MIMAVTIIKAHKRLPLASSQLFSKYKNPTVANNHAVDHDEDLTQANNEQRAYAMLTLTKKYLICLSR